MARNVRIQYEGAIYHGMIRGNRRETIFRDDKDREIIFNEDVNGGQVSFLDWR